MFKLLRKTQELHEPDETFGLKQYDKYIYMTQNRWA